MKEEDQRKGDGARAEVMPDQRFRLEADPVREGKRKVGGREKKEEKWRCSNHLHACSPLRGEDNGRLKGKVTSPYLSYLFL